MSVGALTETYNNAEITFIYTQTNTVLRPWIHSAEVEGQGGSRYENGNTTTTIICTHNCPHA